MTILLVNGSTRLIGHDVKTVKNAERKDQNKWTDSFVKRLALFPSGVNNVTQTSLCNLKQYDRHFAEDELEEQAGKRWHRNLF